MPSRSTEVNLGALLGRSGGAEWGLVSCQSRRVSWGEAEANGIRVEWRGCGGEGCWGPMGNSTRPLSRVEPGASSPSLGYSIVGNVHACPRSPFTSLTPAFL